MKQLSTKDMLRSNKKTNRMSKNTKVKAKDLGTVVSKTAKSD